MGPHYEVTTRVPFPSEKIYNEVLPKYMVVPLFNPGPLSIPSALSQHEATSRTLSLNEMTYKKDFQNESKFKEDSQGEIKTKGLSQSKMANPSLSLFTYLPLPTEGAGGALTGHSTAAHRSLRSLPPALESGTTETKEIGLLW